MCVSEIYIKRPIIVIDTHSHIDGIEFGEDLDCVIARAKHAGVEKVLVPAISFEGIPRLFEVCSQYAGYLYPMIGLHPEEVRPDKKDVNKELDAMEALLLSSSARPAPVAIGEIGLDFYWDDTFRTEQFKAFDRQLEWAEKYHLPVMIHARKAHNELLECVKRHHPNHLRGVFHCFTGSPEMARQLLAFPGFMLGIGGVVTFKNAKIPQTLAESVPLDRIVLETDAPYMSPVPHRGERNEPAFVALVAEKLSAIYGVDIAEVERQTNGNVRCIFGDI